MEYRDRISLVAEIEDLREQLAASRAEAAALRQLVEKAIGLIRPKYAAQIIEREYAALNPPEGE